MKARVGDWIKELVVVDCIKEPVVRRVPKWTAQASFVVSPSGPFSKLLLLVHRMPNLSILLVYRNPTLSVLKTRRARGRGGQGALGLIMSSTPLGFRFYTTLGFRFYTTLGFRSYTTLGFRS